MKIHCIGIGGIGVSALARYYLAKKHQVSGSDIGPSEIVSALTELGAQIETGQHRADRVPKDADMVVYSAAVPEDNPELVRARELRSRNPRLEILTYAQALGRLTRQHKTIAVSGTHGKSTTVSMLALIMVEAGLDPTVIIGTKLNEFGNSNFRLGAGPHLLIEADEWHGSFLNYRPDIIVLTNIEEDHLDYYRDLDHIIETYGQYLDCLTPEGNLVFNGDDRNIMHLLALKTVKRRTPFSIEQKESADIAKKIKVPGEHNIKNALAALSVARMLGVPDKTAYKAIGHYQCCWRRFDQRKGKLGRRSFSLIHDYAHHPTEMKALFQALEERFSGKRIWLVFQPHQYQRTFYFFDRFVDVLRKRGERNEYRVVVTDIYDVPGREQLSLKKKVSAQKLVEAVKSPDVVYWPFDDLSDNLKSSLSTGDVVVVVGAGDIYQWARQLHS